MEDPHQANGLNAQMVIPTTLVNAEVQWKQQYGQNVVKPLVAQVTI